MTYPRTRRSTSCPSPSARSHSPHAFRPCGSVICSAPPSPCKATACSTRTSSRSPSFSTPSPPSSRCPNPTGLPAPSCSRPTTAPGAPPCSTISSWGSFYCSSAWPSTSRRLFLVWTPRDRWTPCGSQSLLASPPSPTPSCDSWPQTNPPAPASTFAAPVAPDPSWASTALRLAGGGWRPRQRRCLATRLSSTRRGRGRSTTLRRRIPCPRSINGTQAPSSSLQQCNGFAASPQTSPSPPIPQTSPCMLPTRST
mmetsp:Transcript_17158/g.56026  ORF Transcript_17158/g.56026 Transcript_17158/m.56026 type:complete len:254 (-) Transcript_17158:214-975(-)